MAHNTYVVEYAKTGRSTALKRARKDTKKIENLEDLIGYDGLTDLDQTLIKNCIAGKIPPPGSGSSGGAAGQPAEVPSDDDAAKKKKKSPKKKEKDKESEDVVKWSVTLKPNFAGGKEITVKDSVILGRGDETGITEKKCSRKQVELRVNEAKGKVTVLRHGVNPNYLTKKGGEPDMMEQNKVYTLEDGDQFTLLMDEYPFTVHIKKQTLKQAKLVSPEKKEKPKKEKPKKEKPKDSVVNLTKKKKKSKSSEEEDNEDNEYDLDDEFINDGSLRIAPSLDEDAEVIKEGLRFVKAEDERAKRKHDWRSSQDDDDEQEYRDGKPVCKFGADCYRKNPEHKQEFWHPSKKQKKAAVEEDETPTQEMPEYQQEEENDKENNKESMVKELKDCFQKVDEDVIRQLLKENDFDQEKTVSALMQLS